MNIVLADLHEWVAAIIVDISFWSCVINIAYILLFILSIYYVRRIKSNGNKELRVLWIFIAGILLLLGINKQLNFQTLLIIIGRSLANKQGWIENRRMVQEMFAIAFAFGIFVLCTIMIFRIRHILLKSWVEISGVGILFAFTLIRAGSIDHIHKIEKVESMLTHIHGLEFVGILIIFLALHRNFKKYCSGDQYRRSLQ